MDLQHLARIDDDGSVRRSSAGTAGGRSAIPSTDRPEVPAPGHRFDPTVRRRARGPRSLRSRPRAGGAAVELRPDGRSDAWPLPPHQEDLLAGIADAWPLADVDALVAEECHADLAPAAVVAAVASGRARHRRPSTRARRPAMYLAAAFIGAAGFVLTAAGDNTGAAQADEPVSVAEELGLVQAGQPVRTEDQATAELQQMVASRAVREDAQAAAAQQQAEVDQAAVAAAAEAARPRAVLPVQGASLSSGFGYRWGTLHAGMDFAAPLGTPEYAAMDGVVVQAGAASGFGLAVYIQHENGDVTVYGHMQQILVVEGQTVRAGDTIALLGNRGQSTGPHLHFEVHLGGIDGERVDPLPWLRDHGVDV